MYGKLQRLQGAFWVHYPLTSDDWSGAVHAYVGSSEDRIGVTWSGNASFEELLDACVKLATNLSKASAHVSMANIDGDFVHLVEPRPVAFGEAVRLQVGSDVNRPEVVVWKDGLADPSVNPNLGVEVDGAALDSIAAPLRSFIQTTARRVHLGTDSAGLQMALGRMAADVVEAIGSAPQRGL